MKAGGGLGCDGTLFEVSLGCRPVAGFSGYPSLEKNRNFDPQGSHDGALHLTRCSGTCRSV